MVGHPHRGRRLPGRPQPRRRADRRNRLVPQASPRSPSGTCCAAPRSSVFIQALLGGLLVVTGHKPKEELHYLYGILPLVVSFIAEGARFGAAERELGEIDPESMPEAERESVVLQIVRREMGIMAVSCWVIFFLALRAATTSGL